MFSALYCKAGYFIMIKKRFEGKSVRCNIVRTFSCYAISKSIGSDDMKHILVVEDDSFLNKMVTYNLSADGYDVISASNVKTATQALNSREFDLVLLDINLSDGNGFELCKLIKPQHPDTIVIFLTANDQESDQIRGYEVGAVDYITKPFGTSELLARLRTAIRHARVSYLTPEGMQTGTFRSGDLVIDYDKHRVYVGEQDAGLTQNEYKIVSLLGKYAGKVLTYDSLIKEIWGPNMKNDNRILRVNMANIRRKIEHNPAQPQYIFTEVGVGYRIVDPD